MQKREFEPKGSQFIDCNIECGLDGQPIHALFTTRMRQLGIELPKEWGANKINTCIHPEAPNQEENKGQPRICLKREAELYNVLTSAKETTGIDIEQSNPHK